MLVARKRHCNGRDAPAIQHKRFLHRGRVALPRDRFVRSGVTDGTRAHFKSALTFFVTAVYDRCRENSRDQFHAGIRASYPPAKPVEENHNAVQSFSPGLPREAAATLGYSSQNPTADYEAARSANFICGHPISPIDPIRPIMSLTLNQPLIKVENGLGHASYKPIIRPKNKGIKPNTNRHKPKNFNTGIVLALNQHDDRHTTATGLPRHSISKADGRLQRLAVCKGPNLCFICGLKITNPYFALFPSPSRQD